MKQSQYLIPTLKEAPKDATIASYELSLRAGFIRQLATGLYTWLPLGVRVLQKIEAIVRKHLNSIGAQEILMPVLQPQDIWDISGRWNDMDKELFRLMDRHKRSFCLGPTHEEVITDLTKKTLLSPKYFPQTLYQIQTKFRDEMRPRFGVMRSREFIMKDAYSFHTSKKCAETTYNQVKTAYNRIFEEISLPFYCVEADSGPMGGNVSHEFHIPCAIGEDKIAFSESAQYSSNVELVPTPKQTIQTTKSNALEMTSSTLSQEKIDSLENEKLLKVYLAKGNNNDWIALAIQSTHDLNMVKLTQLNSIAHPLTLASESDIKGLLNFPLKEADLFSIIEKKIPLYIDYSAAALSDFTALGSKSNQYYHHIEWERDILSKQTAVDLIQTADLRVVIEGDPTPNNPTTPLKIQSSLEIGHIFQLGTKYSNAFRYQMQDESGAKNNVEMCCYGIGISRLFPVAIELFHDENGIIWPDSISPFKVHLIALDIKDSHSYGFAEEIYQQLLHANIEVLFDDRDERIGIKLSDADLIGIPHRLVIGKKTPAGMLEYSKRNNTKEKELLSVNEFFNKINA